ncbi:MFS transporter [Nakamurella multipartita]|jgi:MFS family permease|uniref:Putative proline/betaine transporter n=1 Tax=Nakamurella multipartita (strain ATCC 700099 / DSM 44233 / CIP 104796 / JCM 9543 / NBRC 105858 / Y-104) TaxID=479431 RepID=C8X8Y0_NAKMY|nr:MFS transporter [Nakamurella multipartita]ACV81078.1 major facilitator superfamily MFS_1 [Nakamurella multipartita DSM 44233]
MPAPTARPGRGPLIKAYAASLTGTALEYYDFAVYSAAAALVFPQLFFPGEDPLTGTLLSFSTYAVGFLARPVGGIVFGRLGDRVGRKNVLVWTLMLIGAATLLIGLLPGYASIGVAAPIILVMLRFAQGVGVGGEWGGAVLLSSEYGDPAKRGFWASAAQIGPPAGNLLANGVLAVLAAALTEDAFLSWGWRVAFLISAVLVAFGLWIRLKLEDTPVFQAIKESGERPKAPIKEVFATQKRALTAAALARVGPDVLYALFTVFVATYATQVLGMTRSQVLTAVLIGSAAQLGLIPLAGALSDRINRRLLYAIAAIGSAIWVPVFFLILGQPSMPLLILGVVIGLAFHALMYGPQAAYIVEQFDIHLRYAGSSLAYTLAGVIGGAIAPLVFTALLGAFGSWVPIALYLAGCVAVTLVGLRLGRDPQPQEEEHVLSAAHRPAATTS